MVKAQDKFDFILQLKKIMPETKISGSEIHSYSFYLAEGDLLSLEVEQKGIDIGLEFFSHKGDMLFSVNVPDLYFSEERLWWIAKESGEYKVLVHPIEKSGSGSYIVSSDVRPAKSIDTNFLLGQKSFIDAEKSRNLGTKNDYLVAIDHYRKSIEYWKIIHESEREAVCLNMLGETYYYLGNFKEAIIAASQAINLFPKENGAKAQNFNNLSAFYRFVGNTKLSAEFAEKGVAIARKIGDHQVAANGLNSLGLIMEDIGQLDKCLLYYNEALELARKSKNTPEEASALQNIGAFLHRTGQFEKAIPILKYSLKLWDQIGDTFYKIYTFNELGNLYVKLKEFDEALEYYNDALELSKINGQLPQEIITLSNMGYLFYLRKNFDKSLSVLNQALLKLEGNSSTKFNVLVVSGMVHLELGNTEQSIKIFSDVYESRKGKLGKDLVYPLFNRAKAYVKSGRLDLALKDLEESISILENERLSIATRQIRDFRFSRYNSSVYSLYVNLLMQIYFENPSTNQTYVEQAFNFHEFSLARGVSESFYEGQAYVNRNISFDLAHKEFAIKTEISKKFNKLSTIDKLEKEKIELELDELYLKLEEIEAEVKRANPQYFDLVKPKIAKVADIQNCLDNDTVVIEYGLSSHGSYVWFITKNSFNSYKLPKVSEIEKPAQIIVDYFRFGTRALSVEAKQEILAQERSVNDSINTLSSILFNQIESKLKGKRLVIVPSNILQYIPFSALRLKGKPLIINHEIIILSSSTLLLALKNSSSNRIASNSVAVLADPVFQSTDSRLKKATIPKTDFFNSDRAVNFDQNRLPFSGKEAEVIKLLFANENPLILLGFDANLESLLKLGSKPHRIIHFATHSLIDFNYPERSGLLFSKFKENGEEVNGYLTFNDILNLRLDCDLVVLSSCQTAIAKQLPGEGFLGLSRAFFYAGARKIMLTLWRVEDESTAVLMSKFYTFLKKGLSPAAALRSAQISMLQEEKWKSPYHWAAFQIEGDWK